MALTGTITMFDVGDADAILVELQQEGKHLVVVVDGGRKGDYVRHMQKPLQEALFRANKEAPDIVVLTHYDADHILGVTELVKEYGGKIGQLWAHSPPADFDKKQPLLEKLSTGRPANYAEFSTITDRSAASRYLHFEDLQQAAGVLLESLTQLRDLEKLFPKKITPVFAGDHYAGWPIKVIGPKREYYDRLFSRRSSTEGLLLTEAMNTPRMLRLTDDLDRIKALIEYKGSEDEVLSGCDKLDAVKDRSMSDTNLVSIIFSIKASKGTYLFTGDAGVPSLTGIDQSEIKDLYWLKVPHHGSERNLTCELIDHMKPKYADCSGGKDYLDQHVLDCIGNNPRSMQVRSTKAEGKLTMAIG